MMIDALWMLEKGIVAVRPAEVVEPVYDEIQVEVKACGICAWDRYLFRGISLKTPFPFRFGHEAVGVVVKKGAGVHAMDVGDNVFCIDSGVYQMAQLVNVKADQACKIEGPVDDYTRFIMEPAVCVINALAGIPLLPGDRVALVGTGYMGLLHVQALAHSLISSLIAFDIKEHCISLAQQFGAQAYHPESSEGKDVIREIKEQGGADVVIDCSGSESSLSLSMELMCQGGVFSNFAWHRGLRTIDGTLWHENGYRVFNTAPEMDRHFNDHMIRTERLMRKNVLNHGDLVTHVRDYRHAPELFQIAHTQEDCYIKGVVTF